MTQQEKDFLLELTAEPGWPVMLSLLDVYVRKQADDLLSDVVVDKDVLAMHKARYVGAKQLVRSFKADMERLIEAHRKRKPKV